MHSIETFFSALRWQDILDIAINSYIMFRLYVLFRGTTAFRVMLGLACLWFFQRLSVSVGLIVTSWVIQGITAAAAIIIIVIFRNEIRKVFQAKNLRAIIWDLPDKRDYSSVESLVDVIFELAEKKIGALIVFPGKDDIDDIVETGLPWQGLATREMIKSIFWPGSPVHDGAAILDGRRISKVASILPLSQREDLPSTFGTRHRAAAGLAEQSDALIILVSEETGNVLGVKGKDFIQTGDRTELRSLIRRHTTRIKGDRKANNNERIELGLAAVLSVLLISSVWVSFTRNPDTLISFEVPLRYLNQTPGVEIVEASTDTVMVNLIGAGPLIKSMRPDQVEVGIDLAQATIGKNIIEIPPDVVSLPPGIALKRVTPPAVTITLDTRTDKTLPVQTDWDGSLAEDLLMTGVKIHPQTVRVTGSSLLLKELETLYTAALPLGDIEESGQSTVSVILPDKVGLASGASGQITVQYTIQLR
ncbi:MAG: DNA integrity scanning protein DisA nucleotide-binding domain protein [Deltaproteobacteria bacterium]|nr:DNA integrity scanning protein DisA nucleotide-binding domain protein [Deltaproteobacteria bacterium]